MKHLLVRRPLNSSSVYLWKTETNDCGFRPLHPTVTYRTSPISTSRNPLTDTRGCSVLKGEGGMYKFPHRTRLHTHHLRPRSILLPVSYRRCKHGKKEAKIQIQRYITKTDFLYPKIKRMVTEVP